MRPSRQISRYTSNSAPEPSVWYALWRAVKGGCRSVALAVALLFVAAPALAQDYVVTESAKERKERAEKKERDMKASPDGKLELKEKKQNQIQKFLSDSTSWISGVEVMADIVGPITGLIGKHSYIEAMGRLSLKDRVFPVLEVGYGWTRHLEPTTAIQCRAGGIYGRIGLDFNILRNKHDIYQLFVGVRLGGTSFKYDIISETAVDPFWGGNAGFWKENATCSYLWLEPLIGVDAKIWGPLHLGWTFRYKLRLSRSYSGGLDKAWYVPGFGNDDSSGFQATFSIGVQVFDFLKKNKK